MTIQPHSYQLKGAAQAHFLCESRFKGALIGDAMGLGKTLLAAMVIKLVQHRPGFSVVVAPKSACRQWKETLETSWTEVMPLTLRVSILVLTVNGIAGL